MSNPSRRGLSTPSLTTGNASNLGGGESKRFLRCSFRTDKDIFLFLHRLPGGWLTYHTQLVLLTRCSTTWESEKPFRNIG